VGITNPGWQEDLVTALKDKGIDIRWLPDRVFRLLKFDHASHLLLNLVNVEGHSSAAEFICLQTEWSKVDTQVIHLWEDIWLTRRLQVLSRISAILGMNDTVHGRKTSVVPVTQKHADEFFNRYHLQGSAGCKYLLALRFEDEIVAMAGFSAKRKMTRRTEGYTSAELIRFATVEGRTVTGGFSKLIRHFIKIENPSDVMSYADLDWSLGEGYAKLGFELVAQTPAMKIFLDSIHMKRYFSQRLPASVRSVIADMAEEEQEIYLKSLNYIPVFNTGNLKYVLYL
jgi:hypothetical protein